MAFVELATFPETIAYGAVGGPEYSTGIVERYSGDEQRNQHWYAPRHRYELGLAVRNDTDTRALFTFFNGVARGRVNGFRFPDFNAGESEGYLEPLGVGTGDFTAYQLVKRYTSGNETYDRLIIKPRPGSVLIYADGVLLSSDDASVNTTTGVVTANADADAVLTATFRFDVPVRFVTDRLPMRRIDGGYQWDSIELIETRQAMEVPEGVPLWESTFEYDLGIGLEDYYTTVFTG